MAPIINPNIVTYSITSIVCFLIAAFFSFTTFLLVFLNGKTYLSINLWYLTMILMVVSTAAGITAAYGVYKKTPNVVVISYLIFFLSTIFGLTLIMKKSVNGE